MTNEEHPIVPLKKRRKPWRWILFSTLVGVAALTLYRGWATNQKRTAALRTGQ